MLVQEAQLVTCNICLEEIDSKTAATLDKCSHSFCPHEILQWVRETVSTCPTCRAEVTEVKEGTNTHKIAKKTQAITNNIPPFNPPPSTIQAMGSFLWMSFPMSVQRQRAYFRELLRSDVIQLFTDMRDRAENDQERNRWSGLLNQIRNSDIDSVAAESPPHPRSASEFVANHLNEHQVLEQLEQAPLYNYPVPEELQARGVHLLRPAAGSSSGHSLITNGLISIIAGTLSVIRGMAMLASAPSQQEGREQLEQASPYNSEELQARRVYLLRPAAGSSLGLSSINNGLILMTAGALSVIRGMAMSASAPSQQECRGSSSFPREEDTD